MKRADQIAIIVPILGILLIVGSEFLFQPPSQWIELNGTLPETTKKAIDLLVGLTSLLTSLSLGLIGGVAFFFKAFIEKGLDVTPVGRLLIRGSAASGVLALYFGHLIYTNLVSMLASDYVDFRASFLVWPVRLQYLALLISCMCFLAAVLRSWVPQGTETLAKAAVPAALPNEEL
jgi:hypothetical protein